MYFNIFAVILFYSTVVNGENITEVEVSNVNQTISVESTVSKDTSQYQTTTAFSTNSNTTTNAPVCEPAIPCMDDNDCPGGMCFGWAVGKCNCAACVSLVRCDDDEACGGLVGACSDGYCDCEMGFRNNGLRSTRHAYDVFCNIEECNPKSNLESCFGLPCNPGICICPPEN